MNSRILAQFLFLLIGMALANPVLHAHDVMFCRRSPTAT